MNHNKRKNLITFKQQNFNLQLFKIHTLRKNDKVFMEFCYIVLSILIVVI